MQQLRSILIKSDIVIGLYNRESHTLGILNQGVALLLLMAI